MDMNTTENRPSLALYHANPSCTGCAVKFELHPARYCAEGFMLVRFAKQKTVGEHLEDVPTFPTFEWDGGIDVKLAFLDICKIIQVLRGECESIDDGKGLFHRSMEGATKVVLRHIVMPVNAYSFEVFHRGVDGRDTDAHIMLTTAEAIGLCCALENSMAAICFGNGCSAPLLSKTPRNDNSATATVTGGECGNIAKLREAVISARRSMEMELKHICTEKNRLGKDGQTQEDLCKGCRGGNCECWQMTLKRECDAALAAPPRVCDVGTLDRHTGK